MNFKRILSVAVSFVMTASAFCVAPLSADAAINKVSVYYSEDFEKVTNSDTWVAENSSESEYTPFHIESGWGVSIDLGEENNALHSTKYTKLFPLYQTEKTGKYMLEFDYLPETFTTTSVDWQMGADQIALGSTYSRSYSDILLMTSQTEADENGNYKLDTLRIFGVNKKIQKEGWLHFEVLYDCENMKITVNVTDEDGNVMTEKSNLASTNPEFLQEKRKIENVYFDNFKIYDVVDIQIPDAMGRYCVEDFEDITDSEEWETENTTASRYSPFQTGGYLGTQEVVMTEENNYLEVTSNVRIYPLAQTTKDGKYVLEFDMMPQKYTTPKTNWEAAIFQSDLGSTMSEDWHAIKLTSNGNTNYSSTEAEVPVDTLYVFGNSMTLCQSGWIHFEVVYDCVNMTINAKATDEEGNTVEGNATLKADKDAYLSLYKPTSGATSVNIDNVEIYDYVEASEPDSDLPEGVYYSEDFQDVTDSATWISSSTTLSETNPFQIYSDHGMSVNTTSADKYLQNSNIMWLYPLHQTDKTGKYVLEFDYKPSTFMATSVDWQMGADQIALGSTYSRNYSDILLMTSQTEADANGNYKLDTLRIFGVNKEIKKEGWLHFEVVYDCANSTITVTVTDEANNIMTETSNLASTNPQITRQKRTVADVYFDNFLIYDYKEPEADFSAVMFEEDFESVTASEDWESAHAMLSDENPFYNGGSYSKQEVILGEYNNYFQVLTDVQIYPLFNSEENGRYLLEFDYKPDSYVTPKTNWEAAVFQSSLGATDDITADWHSIKVTSSAGKDLASGENPVDTLYVFDQTMEICQSGWIHFEITYDLEDMTISAKATDEEGNSISQSSALASFDKAYGNAVSMVSLAGMKNNIDNVKITEVGEEEAPVLKASDIKILANGIEQQSASVNPFTNEVKVEFGQKMWKPDMNDENIYVINKATGAVVDCESSYEDGVFTMTFANGFDAGANYTVTVKPVRNLAEVYTEKTYTKDFTIEGGVAAELVSVTQGGSEVTCASDLAAGNAKISISYSNTEDTTPNLHIVVSYYKEGRLTNVDFIKWQTREDLPIVNYEFAYVVPTVAAGYDEVQFTVLDGFDNLTPLSAPITLK